MKNRVNPELRAVLDLFPPLDLDNVEEFRRLSAENLASIDIPVDENVSINEEYVPGPADSPNVR
ncbi:MAG: alpha/beta hydrolase, partial [Heyndrickxia sp.]